MEKSEIEHYLRDIWVREFEKEEKLVVDEFNSEDIELLAKKTISQQMMVLSN